MFTDVVPSDHAIIDLLRKQGSMSVTELAEAMDVTATAVRQRLTRLMAQQYIERTVSKAARGRPSHRYSLTDKGRKQAGANFADLATILWQEVRSVADPEFRRGLLQRISRRLAEYYGQRLDGANLRERMEALVELMAQRQIPFEISEDKQLPVLNALACPYPELAEMDRGVCAMERSFLAEVLGADVKLDRCRLDGDTCCSFGVRQTNAAGLTGEPLRS